MDKQATREVRIKRSQWRRGGTKTDSTETQLLNAQGQMCCLGFFCLQQANMTKDDIDLVSVPWEIHHLDSAIDFDPNEWWGDAIEINDDPEMSEQYREADLVRLFERNGYKLTFED